MNREEDFDLRVVLWLDDERNPFLNLEKRLGEEYLTEGYRVVWVRSFEEFKQYLENNPIPYMISFDHDLAEEHYTPQCFWDNYEASKYYQDLKKKTYKEGTGEDCARFLKSFTEDLPLCEVHSANPVGEYYIKELLKQ